MNSESGIPLILQHEYLHSLRMILVSLVTLKTFPNFKSRFAVPVTTTTVWEKQFQATPQGCNYSANTTVELAIRKGYVIQNLF